MKNIMRRFGIPFFKNRKLRSNRPATAPLLGNELLEKRELLAADLGMADPAMAIFHALSRGGDAMMASMGATQTTTLAVDASSSSSSQVAASTPATDNPNAFAEERVEAAAVAAVATASEPITTLDASDEAEGAPSEDLIEIPIGLNYPDGQNISLTYNPDDGDLSIAVYSPTDGTDLTDSDIRVVQIMSDPPLFDTDATPLNLEGDFDIFRADELTKTVVNPPFFGALSFGNVLPTGLTEQEINDALTVAGAPSIGGSLTDTQVVIDLQATDSNGDEITEIQAGDEFTLTAFVEDVSSGPLASNDPDFGGVFAAYLDVIFDAGLAEAVGPIQYGPEYQNSPTGTVSAGLLDEVGAFAGTNELGRDVQELFSIQMRATGEGSLVIESDQADNTPASDILLYQKDDAIDVFGVVHDSPNADCHTSTWRRR